MNARVAKEEIALLMPTTLASYAGADFAAPEQAAPNAFRRALNWLLDLPRRRAVIAGEAEEAVLAPQRIAGKSRSAMTVRTQVIGSEFMVSVDGKTVDHWTEDRLSMGGIGFQGAADDRARLYWVRLSSPQSIPKEYQTR